MFHVACVGGACVDRKYHLLAQPASGTSNPVRATRGFGGVARNVAENLARLGVSVALLCAVGEDEEGAALLRNAQRAGIDTNLCVRDARCVTPEYAAVVDPAGELAVGVSEMGAVEALGVEDLEARWDALAASRRMFVDCNLSSGVLAWCIERARESGVKLAIDAVSEPKVRRLPERLDGVDLLILNEKEAAAYLCEDFDVFRSRAPLERAAAVLARGAGSVLLARGAQGVTAAGAASAEIPAVPARCIDETGAGDALAAGVLYRLLAGDTLVQAAGIGALCAALTVESPSSVRPDLSPALLQREMHRLQSCAAT